MSKGICLKCGENVGGTFAKKRGFSCQNCGGKMYCTDCAKQSKGFLTMNYNCPECGRKMERI